MWGPFRTYLLGIYLGRLRKTVSTSVIVTGNPAESRTEHLPNTVLKCYLYTSQLVLFSR
jgi:hypothetical protein